MPANSKTIIVDTSCLIALSKINQLSLLVNLFEHVIITREVQKEFGDDLPTWIALRSPKSKSPKQSLNKILDPGEASCIALAQEIENSVLALDEYRARKIAAESGLPFIGTLAILHLGKENGLINSIKPLVLSLVDSGFRVSPLLVTTILKKANEN